MSIVISRDLVLSNPSVNADGSDANSPLIGWQNLVIIDNIEADTAADGYPVTNLANPLTYSEWRADDTSEQYITVNISTLDDIDYVGIARHNLGSGGIPVSIEGSVEDSSPEVWFELTSDAILADDRPVIFRFTPQPLRRIRIRLQTGLEAARMAVVYVGKLLILQRNIYVGHMPISLNIKSNTVTGRSATGHFLGRVILGEFSATGVNLQNLTPVWFRTRMVPFINAAKADPFFFAWRPDGYPREVGYAWLTNDPSPSNQRPNGMMQVDLQMQGIVT